MSRGPGQIPASTIRIGVVGSGFIAQVAHLDPLAEVAGAKLAAIADNRIELREAVAARHAIGLQTDLPADLFAVPEIDAFVVVLPRRAMGPAVEAAVATGKPVLAEKPMGHTLAQGRRLVAAAKASGSALAVGFMKRHDPGVCLFKAELAKLRASGDLGEIVHVAMHDYCATYAVPAPHHIRARAERPFRYPEWPSAPEALPAGHRADYDYTLNVASHDLNLLRYLLGPEERLSAVSLRVRSGRHQLACLDAGSFDVALELGRVDTGRWAQGVDVYFRRGRLGLRLPSPLARQEVGEVVVERSGAIETFLPPLNQREYAFKAQARQFIDVVRGIAPPLASGEDALADLELIEDLWKLVTWST